MRLYVSITPNHTTRSLARRWNLHADKISLLRVSKLRSRSVGFVGTSAALIDRGLVVVGLVEHGRLLVRAFGEEAGDGILAS